MSQLPTAKADTMRPWLTSLAIGCLVAVSACGGYANTVTVAATPQRLVGRIEVTGSAPAILVTLILGNGGAVNLGGELREELRNLSGADVSGLPQDERA